ncbi:MAG: sugar transferase, partial [Armatimonadota bacterium]
MATIHKTTEDESENIIHVPIVKTYKSKRVLDLIAASVGLLIISPIALIVALLIRITSPGPVLFKQTRIGENGKEFTFYKFRSMAVNCDDSTHREYIKHFIQGNEEELKKFQNKKKLYKMTCDNRITPIGKFIRRTSLDEIPQLINVFRGDMSMVGPRPHIPYEVELYKNWHRLRLKGKPGITGWWQIHGRSKVT